MKRAMALSMVRLTAKRSSHLASVRFLSSESITYSGGQATEGQGGYYGSGGSRVLESVPAQAADLLALAADVEKVSVTMTQVAELEGQLEGETQDTVTGKTMELRNAIRKLVTSADFLESLSRLEVKGEPVWGLSEREREMIVVARERVNSS